MRMNADGSGRTAITPESSHQFGPSWSPDGTRLAFVRLVPGEIISTQFDIHVINVDGSGETNLTNSDFDERDPAWSPDGERLASAGVRFERTIDLAMCTGTRPLCLVRMDAAKSVTAKFVRRR
jgi:TolB protein